MRTMAKRKVAICLGYVGSNYIGLQADENFELNTIEKHLWNALYKSGLILESNKEDMSKVAWSRSSRTDKGVHAAKTIVSAKLEVPKDMSSVITTTDDDDDGNDGNDVSSNRMNNLDNTLPSYSSLVNKVNSYLPSDIRVFDIVKTSRGFRARDSCTWRHYEYVIPLDLLISSESEQLDRSSGSSLSVRDLDDLLINQFEVSDMIDPALSQLLDASLSVTQEHEWLDLNDKACQNEILKSFTSSISNSDDSGSSNDKASSILDILTTFDSSLRLFEGSHSFHNFHRISKRNLRKPNPKNKNKTNGSGSSGGNDDDKENEGYEVNCSNSDDSDDGGGSYHQIYYNWDPSSSLTSKQRYLDPKLCCNVYRCSVTGIHTLTTDDGGSGDGSSDSSKNRKMVRVQVIGQSFLLHQIRLMVGAAIMVTRGIMPKNSIQAALKNSVEIPFPMAPSCGLLLRSSAFLSTPDGKPLIYPPQALGNTGQYITSSSSLQKSDQFKNQYIYKRILQDWNNEVNNSNYDIPWIEHVVDRYNTLCLGDDYGQGTFNQLLHYNSDNEGILCDKEYNRITKSITRFREKLIDIENDKIQIEKIKPFKHKEFLPNGLSTLLHVACRTLPGPLPDRNIDALRGLTTAIIDKQIEITNANPHDYIDILCGNGSIEEKRKKVQHWANSKKYDLIE